LPKANGIVAFAGMTGRRTGHNVQWAE
jgi:hypothetical protein